MIFPAFVAALPNEIKSLRKKMKIDLLADIKPGKAYRGTLNKHPSLMTYSGMGYKAATQHAQFLIENFPVTHLFAIGFAGATIPQSSTGDLVIASSVKNDPEEETSMACNPQLIQLAESQSQNKNLKYKI